MTPLLTRNVSNQRTACASSVRVCPHVCCQVYKSTRNQVSVSNTVMEVTGFRSTPTNTHWYPRFVSCHVPRCPIPSRRISHRMRFSELPQNVFQQHTLGDDRLQPVDACSQRATKRDNAHQRHTRSVQSSSCAESGSSSQAQPVSVHGLRPKRVVLQKYCSHPLSNRCSEPRCSSAFQFDVLPEPPSTNGSRRSLPPGFARLDIPLHPQTNQCRTT